MAPIQSSTQSTSPPKSPKKLNAALENYGFKIQLEEVLALVKTTMSSGAKSTSPSQLD
jgi:hypothetical protein